MSKRKKMKVVGQLKDDQNGYALLAVIIFVALSALILAHSLEMTTSSFKTEDAASSRSDNFYETEESLAIATSWLRSNSENLASLFHRDNFYTFFERTPPEVGSNDAGVSALPTKIKLRETSNSIMLTNDENIFSSNFPSSINIASGATFNAAGEFATAWLGSAKVRITLVDAIADKVSKDYGDPALGHSLPETDFRPVFRVDSLTSEADGSHVYAYVVGDLQYDNDFGFFGKDFVELRQPCDSYTSEEGHYNASNKKANCTVGSHGKIRVHQSEKIFGSGKTNDEIVGSSPWGGEICGDFDCIQSGEVCQGSGCAVPDLLPEYDPWSTYCPTNQGSPNISNGDSITLFVPSSDPGDKCWQQVQTKPNSVVTLTTTAYPYFIEELDFHNNSQILFAPDQAGGTIDLYVKSFAGNNFNASQMVNTDNSPRQLKIHYLGSDDIVINGNAQMRAFIIAPYAGVTVSGNSAFYGGIKSQSITATGNGSLHYDESGDESELKDVKYSIRRVTQQYRN